MKSKLLMTHSLVNLTLINKTSSIQWNDSIHPVKITILSSSARVVCWINNIAQYAPISAPQTKNAIWAFQITMQSTFFYPGRFLKNLADNQESSLTKGCIYHTKHMSIEPFTMRVD